MGNEKVLLERLKESRDKAAAIVTLAETETRGMTADETKDFDAHMVEVVRLQGELESLQRAKDARLKLDAVPLYAVPAIVPAVTDDPAAPPVTRIQVPEHVSRAYQKGDSLGAIISARMRFAGYEQPKAIRWAQQTYGESSMQARALQQSSFTAGGAFVPENFVGAEYIEVLRATAKVRLAGARQVTLTNGSWTTPKITGGASGGWLDEGGNITVSQPTTGQVKLVEKKYGVIVPVSNDLRRNSSLETERIVRDDVVRVSANDEDIAFLKGSGLGGQPKGIYNWIPAAGKGTSAGTTLAFVRTDIRTAKNRLNNNNAPNVRRAWFMHSRSAGYMGWDLVDGNSNFAFPQMQADSGAVLGGGGVFLDNNLSIVLGGSSNASEIYYVEMSECFIGDSLELEIELIENATYAVSTAEGATLRSGVSRDESVIRLIRKVDFGMRHSESAFVLEGVTYGA